MTTPRWQDTPEWHAHIRSRHRITPEGEGWLRLGSAEEHGVAAVAAYRRQLRTQVEADRAANGHQDAIDNPSAYPPEVARDARVADARFRYALGLLGGDE